MKLTVPPVACPPKDELTVAINVTAFVTTWGLAELVSKTALCESTTVSVTEDWEPAKLLSPE
jgi:hypothetical protein